MQKTSPAAGQGIVSAKRLGAAVLTEAAAAVLLLLICAALIERETLPCGIEKAYVVVCLVCSASLGGAISASRLRQGRLIAALANAAAFEALLLLSGLVSEGGRLSGEGVLYQLLCVLLGSITGCIMTLKSNKKRKR